ncbi:restriction endonuclease subunit S [Faecalibacterium sp. Marseille-Q3530]|uniref:restriction endonuclease subunit S n=1 Tax=Faecalibacterium sp. Marseille-Q3530 TaxID=2758403 RepID=UPI001A9BACE6|nr:restriction endonuclease subunit S [Faecalibacterium sp. Marseille-Q3530]MBO1288598.1 restriction endonuclease subunit S [Faecalibacterium sp. Marseille-Q3530]
MARKMKDSGIEWIGEIPEGWTKNKVIRLFDTIGSGTTPKNITSDFPVVNWIQSGDITGSFMPACKNVISANLLSQYSALRVYPAPFIIIAMYGASVGNASISLIDGCVNQACCVLSSPSCNLHYAFYVIKSAQSYLVRKAVGGGQPNISQETIKQLWLPLPPLSTQDIIVRNLDATCSKIDDLLTSVHSSIEDYKKLKQAVITQAVTKGVRGEREMKDSGVDYIGQIPSEWFLGKLRNVGDTQNGISKSSEFFGKGFPFVSYSDVYKNYSLSSTVSGLVDSTPEEQKRYSVKKGDIFFTRTSETIEEVGFSCVCEKDIPNATFAGFLIRVRPFSDKLYTPYAKYYFRSSHLRFYLVKEMNLVTRASLGQSLLKSMPVLLPPLEEQKEVADYLDAKCAEIDGLIAKKEQLVKELESYKKSLIYEVVTGKREV